MDLLTANGVGVAGRIDQGVRAKERYFRTVDVTQMADVGETRDLLINSLLLTGEGNGTPLQYSCLENPMDRGAWSAAVHGVAEGWTPTERLHFHFSLLCTGEGNGNPLQCSCLENPRDGGAWWAAIYGVTQSRTRLK